MDNSDDMVKELQDKIIGKRGDPLTERDFNTFFRVSPTPEVTVIFLKALEQDSVDPTIALVQAVANLTRKEQLILISICLRYGADVNTYVDIPKIGTAHLLGFSYLRLKDVLAPGLFNMLISLLVLTGSRASHSMFNIETRGAKVRGYIGPNRNLSKTSAKLSVKDWLLGHGYKVDIIEKAEKRTLPEDVLREIGILLSRTDLIMSKLDDQDLEEAIASHSDVIVESNVDSDLKRPYVMDHKTLIESILYINSNVFVMLVERGILPSYVAMNQILMKMRDYYRNGWTVPFIELERMLMTSISHGYLLDREQLTIASTFGKENYQALLKAYEEPYWKKVCRSSSQEIPQTFKILAVGLGLDPESSKKSICENIEEISQANPERLKEALVLKKRERLASELGKINEFITSGENGPMFMCHNKSLLSVDVEDVAEIDVDSYRDDQGKIWCFTSDMFLDLLESRVNPYTTNPLPQGFLDKLNLHVKKLSQLGLDRLGRDLITFSASLKKLTEADKVTNEETDRIIDAFMRIAQMYGLNSDSLQDLDRSRMEQVLRLMGINISLKQLTINHSFITFVRILMYRIKDDVNSPNSTKAIFSHIKLALKS